MLKKLAAILVLTFLLAGCSGKPQLVIYTWSDMFPPEVLKGFENENGIKIRYVNFDTNETMLAKLKAAKGGRYDIIIADDYMLENVFNEKLAQKLDHSRLANFSNINPLFQKQFYDPFDEYTVPYGAGVQTIVYDPKKVNFSINRYLDLWHPDLRQRLGIIDNYRVINGMALKVMGQSYNTNDLSVIREAGSFLSMLSPNIRLIRDNKLEDELVSGEISAAVMYTSQVTMAKIAKPDLKVIFPAEGLGFGIMGAFIPSAAPNVDTAYAFLDYILDAERGAKCFEYLGYYSTFSASDSWINAEYRDFLTLPENFLETGSMEMIQNISHEAEELHNLIWTEFKAGTK